MMSGYAPQVGGTVVRAEAVLKLGPMDRSLIGGTDWDWQLRIAGPPIGFVEKVCVLFRNESPRHSTTCSAAGQAMRGVFSSSCFGVAPVHTEGDVLGLPRRDVAVLSGILPTLPSSGRRLASTAGRRALISAFTIIPPYATRRYSRILCVRPSSVLSDSGGLT